MAKFVILGMGGFGLALAALLDRHGGDVTVWTAFEEEMRSIREDGENKQKLPGVAISERIRLTTDIRVISAGDIVIVGIPSGFVRQTIRLAAPYISDGNIVVNTSKGLEDTTYKRMSEVIKEELDGVPAVVLSGPSHAEEVALGIPTTVALSSEDMNMANAARDAMTCDSLRMYINDDVAGCEIGGALKNVIALCAGICDGMGYGDNTKAALMTRGMTEIARLGVAMGGRPQTFAGLTGMGDLIVTCTSLHSRNRRAGILIGQGVSPEEAVKQTGTVEGYFCTKAAFELSRKLGVEMPIAEQCYNVLFEGLSPRKALKNLMDRPRREGIETVWV